MNFLSSTLRLMPLLLMGLLTLGTYWMVKVTTAEDNSDRPKNHTPDYIVDNVIITTLSATGDAKYRIIGDRLTHYEDDASAVMDNPIARRFNPDKPPTTVRSDKALMNGDISILDLDGNASLIRPAQPASGDKPGSARLFMSSSRFTILLNDDVVKTNRPVVLEQGQSIMTSQEGASFDNVTQKLTMIGQVRGRIESEKQAK
jgi:lipopolysaccharide export system protein LptC